jgi:hypothetical protein
MHFEFVDVGTVVVLGVGSGGIHDLVDELGALLGHELQRRKRTADRLAADDVGNQAALLRRDAGVLEFGGDFHGFSSQQRLSCRRNVI